MSNPSTPGPSSRPSSAAGTGSHKHALTAVEKQRSQLERLLKDPSKPVYIPAPPKEKGIRPPREMMKNVQGSSAGAGSGEFHVYKAARRREYERLKMLEEQHEAEVITSEFEKKRAEADAIAEAKTAKNRAKRQKKKEKSKSKGPSKASDSKDGDGKAADESSVPFKKRRLVVGQELMFKRPGGEEDESGDEEDGQETVGPQVPLAQTSSVPGPEEALPVKVVEHKINIIEDD
ncbi:hypothetical protein D9611_003815 [Ephemerocybe angulata]|uniref:DUF1168-domain-containing protein n=1 Tax=Ephemerocybe angulata TaxID=980116 RepID=A0A8H5B668_9AGAR|nr:hypothetical protein D9611_003815 [Tulosesus angulatus]